MHDAALEALVHEIRVARIPMRARDRCAPDLQVHHRVLPSDRREERPAEADGEPLERIWRAGANEVDDGRAVAGRPDGRSVSLDAHGGAWQRAAVDPLIRKDLWIEQVHQRHVPPGAALSDLTLENLNLADQQ